MDTKKDEKERMKDYKYFYLLLVATLLAIIGLWYLSLAINASYGKYFVFQAKSSCRGFETRINGTLKDSMKLQEIFYSNRENSCLYAYSEQIGDKQLFSVYDYFTGELLFNGDQEKYEETIKNYRK